MSEHHGEDDHISGRSTNTDESRRNFLKGAAVAGSAAALVGGSLGAPYIASANAQELQPRQVPLPGRPDMPGRSNHWYVPASDKTVHWGYFSKSLKPIVEIESGDYVTLECLTHQAGDDPERMINGDPGAERV
jgi:FtsP/CotA-like multicopper oxidase with cupredoxin domain